LSLSVEPRRVSYFALLVRICSDRVLVSALSSLLEYQDIHERQVVELLRKVKSFGLDLFHDVFTVQADVTANFVWAGGRVGAVAIVVRCQIRPKRRFCLSRQIQFPTRKRAKRAHWPFYSSEKKCFDAFD